MKLLILLFIAFCLLVIIGAFSFTFSYTNHIEINRCYVPMGNKYYTFNEKDYKMTLRDSSNLYIYRKCDNHLMLITSSFTCVCDDSIDPNMTTKPEKE